MTFLTAAPRSARWFARLAACCGALLVLAASGARAELGPHDSDAVLPNSPFKERGMPDAGQFNPAEGAAWREAQVAPAAPGPAPAAMTYYPPAIVIEAPRAPRPYQLVAAPTLPCAPAYCPRPRPRADRN